MNELEIRKIAKEEFISNVMNNLDSTLIFTYIQNLEQKENNLQSKIDKAIEYYETHQQECVIGRNKDDKLIKDYYLPAQCSKKLYEFLKEAENVENN